MLVGRAVRVRSAVVADGDQLAAIWNHEVLWTDATTDTEPRDGRAQREWLERHRGDASAVVAVVGDSSIVNGMAFEGLNGAGTLKRQMLIILNDNAMSISHPQGAFAQYLDRIRVSERTQAEDAVEVGAGDR